MVEIRIDFEGGLENDFASPKGLKISVPEGMTVRNLPGYLSSLYLKDKKPNRFVADDGSILPGILTMVNDVDSEIGGVDVAINKGDSITFISTLHGG